MMWAIKHKSGLVLFVTSDEFIADNRRKMGWIVEKVKMTSRERFEAWYKSKYLFQGYEFDKLENGSYQWVESMWQAWQASRADIEIDLPEPMNPSSVFFGEFERGEAKGISECVNKIEQAGLKVKK